MNQTNCKNILIILLIVVLTFSCKGDPIKPDDPHENNDIVPQININWPSLADSPWPMYHHDPQSTGRSRYIGPANGDIIYKSFNNFETMSGISLGYNQTAFLPSGDFANSFVAFDYDGNLVWEKKIRSVSTPLISQDTTIFLPTVDGSILAYNQVGDTLWMKNIDKMSNIGINIDLDGNIYFIDRTGEYPNDEATLKVLDEAGNIKWNISDNRILGTPDAAPSFSPDGKTIYVQGNNISVLAVDIDSKKIKWTFGDKILRSSPVIDNAGNIYIIPGDILDENNRVLFCLKRDGNVKWKYEFIANKVWNNTPPTIDYDGNIYFGADTLYSISNSGNLRWKKYLEGGSIITPLVSDLHNNIYVGTSDIDQLFAFKNNGDIKWHINNIKYRGLGTCPAITEVGSMIIPSFRNAQFSISIVK